MGRGVFDKLAGTESRKRGGGRAEGLRLGCRNARLKWLERARSGSTKRNRKSSNRVIGGTVEEEESGSYSNNMNRDGCWLKEAKGPKGPRTGLEKEQEAGELALASGIWYWPVLACIGLSSRYYSVCWPVLQGKVVGEGGQSSLPQEAWRHWRH